MANSEFIEIISPQAKQQIADIMKELEPLAKKISEINNFKPSNTPSGSDNNIKKLTDDLNKQAKEIDNLKTKLAGLNQEKARSNTLTTQQKVDNAIILKQEKQKAVLTSEYAKAYEKLNMQRTIAKQKLQDYIAEETRSNKEIRQAQKEFDVLNKKVAAADKAVGRFSDANRKINGLASSVGNLMTAFGIGTGIYLAVDIAKNIYETTKALQSLDLALKMVSGTQEEFASNQAFVTATAEKWGVEIKTLTEQYTYFYTAAKGLMSTAEIKTTFEGIAKAGAVMGLSLEKQSAAFYAFEQMMSKGIVTSEELKKQLGNSMPGAIRAAAMAYMELHPQIKSIQEAEMMLLKEMKRGAIDSATYVPLIVKNLEKLYGIEMVDKVETLQAAQNRLKNSWTELVRTMTTDNEGAFARTMRGSISLFNDLTISINKAISSISKLRKNAMQEGIEIGIGDFRSQFESEASGLTKEGKIELAIKKGNDLTGNIKKALYDINLLRIQYNVSRTKENEEELKLAERRLGYYRGQKIEAQNIVNELSKLEKPKSAGTTETEAQRKARLAREEKDEKDRLKAIEDANKLEYDLKMSNLEVQKELAQQEIDLANAVTQNKEIQYQDVIDATKYYNGVLIAIEKAKYDEEVRLAGENSKLKEIAYNKWFISTLKLSKEMAESLLKVTQDFAKDGNDVAKKMLSDFEENAKAFDEIDKKMNKAKADNDQDRLESQRRAFNEFMGGLADKSGFKDTFDLLGQINPETGKTIMGDLLDTDDKGEKAKAYFLAVSTVAQDAMNAIDQADEERYQNRLARLEKEKEVALRYAGDSATAKAKIEADYDKKRKSLELKEFKRKQKMAIANIAIDTAQAAMASWAKDGFPWAAAAAIAMGAIQIGIVAAQKPPEYWKGTDNAEAGLAWTNERGAEIVTDKHGYIKDLGDNKGARLTMMEKGDKVYTAQQTKKMMFDDNLNSILTDNGISNAPKIVVNSGMTKSEMEEVMLKTLGAMPMQSTIIDKNGLQHIVTNGHSKTIFLSNRVSGVGLKV